MNRGGSNAIRNGNKLLPCDVDEKAKVIVLNFQSSRHRLLYLQITKHSVIPDNLLAEHSSP